MRAARCLAATTSILGLLAGCGSPTDPAADPRPGERGVPGEVATVEIVPSRTTLRVGDTTALAVQLRDFAGSEAVGTVTWFTLDFTTATVSARTGLVVAVAPGQARIVANSNGKADTALVDVPFVPIASMDIAAPDSSFLEDRGTQLVAIARDGAGIALRGKSITWSTSDVNVATVSPTGAVTGRGPGVVIITATGEQASATMRLFFQPVFIGVASGAEHACGLSKAGLAFCWGRNDRGQLGDGTSVSRNTMARVATQARFVIVEARGAHTCGVTENSLLYCWGANDSGQLGDGTTASRTVPTMIPGSWNSGYIRLGPSQTCAYNRGGPNVPVGIYCWGDNTTGQFGTGPRSSVLSPLFRATYTGPLLQTFGAAHTCSMYACWGSNEFGQLGDGTTTSRETPVYIVQAPASDTLFNDLDAGPATTCAVRNGRLWCWGRMHDGIASSLPQEIRAGLNVGGQVGVGENHGCTLSMPGRDVYCWGGNADGQVGDGTTIARTDATLVTGPMYVKDFATGLNHTCALTQASEIYCWGRNDHGQLGNGSYVSSPTPRPVLFR